MNQVIADASKATFLRNAVAQPGELIGYCRVSTNGQERNGYSLDDQKARLKEAGCRKIYADTASGSNANRSNLTKMLDRLHPGDVVVVVKLDRLAHSLHDLVVIVERIGKLGAAIKSLTEPFDTSNPFGRAAMGMIAVFAEFERELIKERTRIGIEAAKRAGRKLGPHFKLSDETRQHIVHMIREGKMIAADCARTYGIHPANISRLLARSPIPKEVASPPV
jgi:DNA invertase Pin-like site-specific DNA recombinase